MASKQEYVHKADPRQWAQERMDMAPTLIKNARKVMQDLFSSGNLSGYLALMSRLYYFDTENLLLIYEKYPQAIYLATFNHWSSILPEGAQVLKREGIGKGIDLLAPFTHYDKSKPLLVWYSVKMYDVAQTNVDYSPPTPVYKKDKVHISILIESVKYLLGALYDHPVLEVSVTHPLLVSGAPGLISEKKVKSILLCDGLTENTQLQWLTQVLIRFSLRKYLFYKDYDKLLEDSIYYCLFNIWELPQFLASFSLPVSDVHTSHQLEILNHIRHIVETLDGYISSSYIHFRKLCEEHLDMDF